MHPFLLTYVHQTAISALISHSRLVKLRVTKSLPTSNSMRRVMKLDFFQMCPLAQTFEDSLRHTATMHTTSESLKLFNSWVLLIRAGLQAKFTQNMHGIHAFDLFASWRKIFGNVKLRNIFPFIWRLGPINLLKAKDARRDTKPRYVHAWCVQIRVMVEAYSMLHLV